MSDLPAPAPAPAPAPVHEAGFALDARPMSAARSGAAEPRPSLWLPYAQMSRVRSPLVVRSAEGPRLHLEDGRVLVDAVSSWWSVVHGYNHPRLSAAARRQLADVSHVMLGGLVHPTTRRLADTLAAIAPGELNHVFFGDSGSVGVEIALKMAIQFWQNTGRPEKKRIASLENAYHGDTFAAMAVSDPAGSMHRRFDGVVRQQLAAPAPRGGFEAAPEVIEQDAAALEAVFEAHAHELAAFIVEPVMQAAGGFNFYSPGYLQRARALCDRYDVLLIFDEIATGFGRTGKRFAADHAGVAPDVMILGKALTAGYAGHAATIATPRVFDAFGGESVEKALMHGPTFMGNAATCAVALEGIALFDDDDYPGRIAEIERRLTADLAPIQAAPGVADVRVLGACGVVEVEDAASLAGLQDYAAGRGVWLRPFERYAYTMPPYVVSDDDVARITGVMRGWFGV